MAPAAILASAGLVDVVVGACFSEYGLPAPWLKRAWNALFSSDLDLLTSIWDVDMYFGFCAAALLSITLVSLMLLRPTHSTYVIHLLLGVATLLTASIMALYGDSNYDVRIWALLEVIPCSYLIWGSIMLLRGKTRYEHAG